uniref:Uncharacterized protein n=1 Tax=Glossina austeni TaxID=7395 RepID=A0A1A9VHW3_GLOAU
MAVHTTLKPQLDEDWSINANTKSTNYGSNTCRADTAHINGWTFMMESNMPEQELTKTIKSNGKPCLASIIFVVKPNNMLEKKKKSGKVNEIKCSERNDDFNKYDMVEAAEELNGEPNDRPTTELMQFFGGSSTILIRLIQYI